MTVSKLMAFARAATTSDRSELQSFVLARFAPRWMASDASVLQLFADIVGPVPEGMPWRRPDEASPVPDEQPYDVVIEAWFETRAEALAAADRLPQALGQELAALDCFVVDEFIEKERPVPAGIGQTPGLKYIGLCSFHDDLPDSAARRSWKQHVGLALVVHAGMAKYVRNWVEEAPAVSPALQDVRGIVELHFDSLSDLQQRWFDSDRGRQEIIQDVGHFLKGATRMFAVQHVLEINTRAST